MLDVGGGDSHLMGALVARGLDCLAVLDVSDEALTRLKARIGSYAPVISGRSSKERPSGRAR